MQPVERSNPEGVDFGWVMQTTFVVTIVVGALIVAALSSTTALPTWGDRVGFAVRVGAVIWFVTAVVVYAYARRTNAGDGGTDPDSDVEPRVGVDTDPGSTLASGSERNPDSGAGSCPDSGVGSADGSADRTGDPPAQERSGGRSTASDSRKDFGPMR